MGKHSSRRRGRPGGFVAGVRVQAGQCPVRRSWPSQLAVCSFGGEGGAVVEVTGARALRGIIRSRSDPIRGRQSLRGKMRLRLGFCFCLSLGDGS